MRSSTPSSEIWTTLLDVTALFVTPDWDALIALLPILVVLGVVGPFLTFTLLGSAHLPRAQAAREGRVRRGPARRRRSAPTASRSSRRASRTAGATRSSTRSGIAPLRRRTTTCSP